MKSPPGSRAFRVSGSVKPHWGLVFFYPKNEIPTGVSGIQGVGSAKPHRGLMFFYPKNGIPTGVLGIHGVWKCKTPPGSGVFLFKKWNPRRGLGYSGCREVQTTPCSLLSQIPWKSETHPVSSYLSYPECLILKNSGCFILMDITKTYRGLKKNCVFLSLS